MVDTKMTKTVGEHWTCACLARAGWAPALTRDGVERSDILAVATHLNDRPTIEVQVKAANETGSRTSWMLGPKAQLSAQSVREWFVFVLIPKEFADPIRGYVVPRDHVTAAAWLVHQHWLTDPTVKAGTRNTPQASARVNDWTWAGYEARWDLLDLQTAEVPVLLPADLREWALMERVGLPTGHEWNRTLPLWH